MNLLKTLTKLKPEQQLLLGIAIIVLLSSLFWRSGANPFSIGASAHFGNLKGRVELEAFDSEGETTDRHDDNYLYRKKAFVLFHVPWCGYCKNVLPIWNQLAQQTNNDVNIMKIDCEKFTDISKKHQIDSYPTIRFYPNGLNSDQDYVTYMDTRDLESFQRFLEKHSTSRVGVTETFKNTNNYSAPVGYNDYEIFEPFATEKEDGEDEPARTSNTMDNSYLRYMAGGKPGIPLSFSN